MAHQKGNPVHEARIRAKLSMRELAALAGVGERTLARAEAGETVSELNAQKIADALGFDSRHDLFPQEAVA